MSHFPIAALTFGIKFKLCDQALTTLIVQLQPDFLDRNIKPIPA